jgi:ABC-type Na+ efflux pump permease subunit
MTKDVPSTASVLLTLMGTTWRRLLRGRALWVMLGLNFIPLIPSSASRGEAMELTLGAQTFMMLLLPAVFVASAIGEEIEDRTATYLWSRPIARWTLVAGKLLAIAPIAALLIVASWNLAMQAGTDKLPSLQSTLAFAAGAVAVALIAAGVALLVPKHGMALTIIYLVLIDLPMGALPASLQSISVTRQVRLLAELEYAPKLVTPAITLAVIAAVWLALGLYRLRRLEA